MAAAHRHGDLRICTATTIVQGQGSVYVNGKLWAVHGDPNSHEEGELINGNAPNVYVEGKGVIVVGDLAEADALCPIPPHCVPSATEGSGDVFAT